MKEVRVLSIMLALFFASTLPAGAITISIDPGAVGTSFTEGLFPFSDLKGTPLSGQTLNLDFVFAGMKHLELISSPQASGQNTFVAAILLGHDLGTSTAPPHECF